MAYDWTGGRTRRNRWIKLSAFAGFIAIVALAQFLTL
jgi:hypothetical protein